MKISFIIFILSTIGYISCSTNIIDISVSNEYFVNTNDTTLYPNGIIPKDTTFYFRLGDIGEINNILQLRTLSKSKDIFIVKAGYFVESPHESEVDKDTNLETLKLERHFYDGVDDIFVYYLEPLENSQYILISITLKSDLDYLSVYIKNDEEQKILQYNIVYYTDLELPVKEYQDSKVLFALNLTEDNIGDTSIYLVIKHTDKKMEFYLGAIGLKTGTVKELEEEMKKDTPNFIDISLNETLRGVNDLYIYYLKLDENSKYIYVFIQTEEKLDNLEVRLTFPQKPLPIYNVVISKEYEIDLKYLIKNRYNCVQIKSTNSHIGDTFIKLKVKKGVSKDYFFITGFGEEEFIENEYHSSLSTVIRPEFSKTFHKNNYDIHQYYFKAEKKTAFYYLNIDLYEKTEYDYLSFKVDYTSEKDEDEDDDDNDNDNSTVLVVIIVIICVLIGLAITYFVLRKFGIIGKNNISSKDIESSNQIMPNA